MLSFILNEKLTGPQRQQGPKMRLRIKWFAVKGAFKSDQLSIYATATFKDLTYICTPRAERAASKLGSPCPVAGHLHVFRQASTCRTQPNKFAAGADPRPNPSVIKSDKKIPNG
jgi:hypothetical protein